MWQNMKTTSSSFTLIETVIATAILVAASAVVASLFVSSIRTSLDNQERTVADLLLSDKLEKLTVTAPTSATWLAGDYLEYVSIDADGLPIVSPTDSSLKYLRTWQVSAAQPKTVTVVVYSTRSAITGRQTELIRATAAVAARW